MNAAVHRPSAIGLADPRFAPWASTCSGADTTPLALAAELALFASDLHGFDNGDRQRLRNIARALLAPSAGLEAALALAEEATQARTGIAYQRSRPEATVLVAVQYLLQQASRAATPTSAPA